MTKHLHKAISGPLLIVAVDHHEARLLDLALETSALTERPVIHPHDP